MTTYNIIGRSPDYEAGYDYDGIKLTINYFDCRSDILFEMHPEGHPYSTKLTPDRENAKAAGMQLVTQQTQPISELIEYFDTDFFDSSGDLAIAYAIFMGADKIRLFGMAYDDIGDHWERRACTNYWIGYARGKGITVEIMGNSTLCTSISGLTYGTFTPMKRRYEKIIT